MANDPKRKVARYVQESTTPTERIMAGYGNKRQREAAAIRKQQGKR